MEKSDSGKNNMAPKENGNSLVPDNNDAEMNEDANEDDEIEAENALSGNTYLLFLMFILHFIF